MIKESLAERIKRISIESAKEKLKEKNILLRSEEEIEADQIMKDNSIIQLINNFIENYFNSYNAYISSYLIRINKTELNVLVSISVYTVPYGGGVNRCIKLKTPIKITTAKIIRNKLLDYFTEKGNVHFNDRGSYFQSLSQGTHEYWELYDDYYGGGYSLSLYPVRLEKKGRDSTFINRSSSSLLNFYHSPLNTIYSPVNVEVKKYNQEIEKIAYDIKSRLLEKILEQAADQGAKHVRITYNPLLQDGISFSITGTPDKIKEKELYLYDLDFVKYYNTKFNKTRMIHKVLTDIEKFLVSEGFINCSNKFDTTSNTSIKNVYIELFNYRELEK